jgi:methylenetetrahydrofolate dehydrogenase (NADP+)/methenyltetrahydrofolate cyclohydrolase
MPIQYKILDGKKAAEFIIADVNREITEIPDKTPRELPKLGVILVGDNPASESYVKNKIGACQKAGINHMLVKLDSDISENELMEVIYSMNRDKSITGFIVQLPLPNHIDVNNIINSINPDKDVDGFHPINFGKTALGLPSMKPATPYGILKLIKFNKIETKGKHVVIVGRSNIVGKPLSIMLGNDFEIGRATVTSCDINTPSDLLLSELKRADIVIIAVGKPGFLTGDMVKEGVVVIDVGINKVDGKIVGDVHFESVSENCSLITPVPGGVGPMTISALIVNTLNAWKKLT